MQHFFRQIAVLFIAASCFGLVANFVLVSESEIVEECSKKEFESEAYEAVTVCSRRKSRTLRESRPGHFVDNRAVLVAAAYQAPAVRITERTFLNGSGAWLRI